MSPPLPLTRPEMLARGWDSVDVVFDGVIFIMGDTYVDHPSFAAQKREHNRMFPRKRS